MNHEPIFLLGIHDGHNCGATLCRDGQIVAAISEERLSRIKNDVGYPARSIEEVLRLGECSSKNLTSVVYASEFMHSRDHLRNVEDWYRVGLEDQHKDKLKTREYLRAVFEMRRRERIQQGVDHLGVPPANISFLDHHTSHAAAAYFGAPVSLADPILVLTCDGAGDGLSATVSIGKNGRLERLSATGRAASVGKLYSRVTYLLGMTPWEHEYKVMGLAPYGETHRAKKLSDVFQRLVTLDESGLAFQVAGEIESNYSFFYLREQLERVRFDEIAGAVQLFLEEILRTWVRNCVRATGIPRIACAGGVFMNVKANQRIAALDEVEQMFVFPSCGDESLSFGAVWLDYTKRMSSPERIAKANPPLGSVYLGADFSEATMRKAIEQIGSNQDLTVEESSDIEYTIADALARDEVVARFDGRMEWGARALGNRSILASPRNWTNVEKINSMIKMRDFWMPFAPSILKECQAQYLINPKKLDSPFMMLAFDTTPEGRTMLTAATHPRDHTARAHLVDETNNPRYARVIREFQKRTGIGGVLNTSFNLHGHPLVYSPQEAVDVFLRSGLDCLALGHFLLRKRQKPAK